MLATADLLGIVAQQPRTDAVKGAGPCQRIGHDVWLPEGASKRAAGGYLLSTGFPLQRDGLSRDYNVQQLHRTPFCAIPASGTPLTAIGTEWDKTKNKNEKKKRGTAEALGTARGHPDDRPVTGAHAAKGARQA